MIFYHTLHFTAFLSERRLCSAIILTNMAAELAFILKIPLTIPLPLNSAVFALNYEFRPPFRLFILFRGRAYMTTMVVFSIWI